MCACVPAYPVSIIYTDKKDNQIFLMYIATAPF